MAITNTWSVQQLQCYPEAGGLTDVVFSIRWQLDATDGTYNAYVCSEVGVTLDPNAPYTPYAELTEAQVAGWVQTTLGPDQLAEYESGVAAQIDAQANPRWYRHPFRGLNDGTARPSKIPHHPLRGNARGVSCHR